MPDMSLKRYVKATIYTAYVRAIDASTRRCNVNSHDAFKALGLLRRDGFVNLGQMLPLGNVADRVAKALTPGESTHTDVTRFYLKNPLVVAPEIWEWMRLPMLNEVVCAYLGDRAVFDRCLVWRIPANANKRNTSAIWHHDWCGHRLKLFILLHDVGEAGRPTQYVRGSHRGQWRWMDYSLSRYDDSYVENLGEVTKLIGQAGDCILLDTNGLHRATGEGGYEARDIVCLEYSDPRKSDVLAARHFEIGIRRDLIPDDVKLDGTLLSVAHLHREGGRQFYGFVPQLEKEPFIDAS
jgi:hypothetical protein